MYTKNPVPKKGESLRTGHTEDEDYDNDYANDDDDDDDDGCSPFYLRPFYLPSLLPTSSR